MAQDIDFSRMLDELDEPETTGFGTPVAEPSQEALDAFDLPGSTRKLIDDVVSARESERRQSDYVEKGKEIISGLTDPQQYAEFGKGIVPGAISMGGTAIQAPDAIAAKGQQGAAKFGRKQLEIMDRIDRGEAVPEMEDPIGYAYMSQEQRQAARREQEQATAEFNPTPVGERPFFKAGEKVQKFAKDLMPAAPGYEESVGRQLGEGMGSMAFGLPLAYFGGPVVAGTAFGSAGIGEATQRAVEYDRKEKAAGRPGLTEDQIATAGILGVGPGATDLLPVEVLIGRLPVPLPPALRRPLAMAIGRIGGQAFIEGAQEGGQAFLQNLIAREVYNPSQPLVDGIGHEMGIGAGVGGIAETAKELGVWMLKSGAIRRKKGIHDSLVEHEKAQEEAAQAAGPDDTRTLAPSQEGPTPRLEPGQSSVRGALPTEPAIQDAERLLSEINQGTIAEPESVTQSSPAPESGAITPETGAITPEVSESGATPAVPTFQDAFAALPKDSAGDPDIAAFMEATGGRPYNQLTDAEKIDLVQRLRGEAPTEAAGAVSQPEAATPAPQAQTPATAQRSLTDAIEEGTRQLVEDAVTPVQETAAEARQTAIGAAERAKFAEVLATKEKRSNWGQAAGLSEPQVKALIDEAIAGGRLRMLKGHPVRTAKVRKAAPATPLAQEAAEAVTVPMGRAAERRLEGVQDPLAYRHAAKLLGLAGKPRKIKAALKDAKKALKRAQADQIFNALVPGAPRPKNIGQVFDAIEKALGETNAVGPALRDDARPLSEGSISEGVRPDGEVGRAPDAPRDDLGGSLGDVGRPDGADADQLGPAGGLPGAGEGARVDAGAGARDGERGTDTPAPPETGLTPEQKAEVEAQVRSDSEKLEQARRDRERLNYQITDADEIGKGGPKAKVRGNIAAIKKLREIEETGREPTEEDKRVLVKYVGWGAFAQDVFTDYKTEWKAERDQIKDLLSPAEYASARASTLDAHYTSPEVIRAMWDGLKHLGFKGGRALEPAAGIGHYIGLTPSDLRSETAWTAVELDPISAGITKALYGAADVRSAGFETQKWPDDFFDLAVSNVPFGNFNLEDADTKGFLIHDYFFIKSLAKVRPGGVVAFITSAGTLDKENGRARTAMSRHAKFLGAVRLPGGNQGAFKGNAGTEVTTDIIFFRKRVPGEPAEETHDWRSLTEIKTPEGPTKINSYFAANPDMMLGKMRLKGTMYSAGEPVLIGSTENLGPKIVEAIQRGLPENAMLPKNTTAVELSAEVDTATDGIKEGSFYEKDGVLYRKIIGVGQPQKLNATDKSKVRAFIGIRNVVNQMLAIQSTGGDSYNMGKLRETLGKAYDAFVKAHGPINQTIISQQKRKDGKEITVKRQPTLKLFEDDPDAFKVSAIEVYDEKTGKAKKAAIFTEDIVGAYVPPDVKGPADALAVSLNERGKVDIELIASRLGVSEAEAIVSLGDQIYLSPNGEQWQTRAEYLSGDVVEKLEVAKVAAELDPGRYMRNVEALEAVQPEPLTRQEITVPFGAPWVPAEVYNEFLQKKLGATWNVKVSYNPQNARWTIVSGGFNAGAQENFGTSERSVEKIVEYALNSESIVITTKGEDDKPVRMPEAEQEARARVDAIRELFSGDPEAGVDGWVWEDEARAERLEALYNRNYNRLVPQNYDGSHLTFPGLARVVTFPDGSTGTINLLPHRVNAIWRVIQKGNTLFNHVVGSGKTWTSIMAAMEMKRLGMVQRPMFVVPNHMLNQFATEFYQAYPNAKLLIATKDQMSSKRRREFAAKAAADKWDGIIITHSAFTRIGMQPEAYKEFYEQQIEEMIEAKEQAAKDEGKDSRTVKDLEKARKQLETKLKKLTDESSKDVGVTFEELGVDHLTVDEAHLFKSLQFATRHTRVKGISNKGESKRATDLFIKMRHLEKSRPGRSAVFLTGTPVSNTMAELFTMQRYLQEGTLRKYGIAQFDSWAGTFGKIVTKSELGSNSRDYVDTESFSQFVNMPELMAIVGDVMDTQTADMLKLPRPNLRNGKIDVVEAELSELEQSAIDQLVEDMQQRDAKTPFLPLFTRGIQLATDMRLVDPSAPFNPKGKIGKAVDNIFKIWTEGNTDPKAPNKAQIVFLDMGVPGSKGKRTVSTKDAAPVDEVDVAEQIRQDLMAEANAAMGDDTDGEAVEVDESDVQAQALLQGKFNLYQDIKDRLIEKGVPAEQIAFIHDAKNDDQKAKMFEKVRAGEIRVLIGSTGKMGVGTNVQRQLIAMHHLDAPWKPADVEQRDGRILRQGNKNPEVRILRYITKKSFDAYRWQLLDRKSNFIGQLFAGALGVRNAEDIDPPLPEAAELKAAATGNPLIVERAELEREVRTLEAAERAHVRGQKQAAVNAAKIRSYLETTVRFAEAYEADAQLVTDLSGENFTVDLAIGRGDPVTVTERKKAGEAVRAYLLARAGNAYYGRKSDVTLGRISGFEMAAEVERTPDGFAVKPMIAGRESYSPNEAFLLTETSDPIQLIRRWEKLVGGVRQHVENVRSNIAKNTADLPKLEEAARPKPFGKAEMLAKAKGRLQEVVSALSAKPVPAIEEDRTPLQDIVNPIDRNATAEEQLRQIAVLTAENKPLLDGQLKELDAAIGTTSNANVKKPETIVAKASRPSILKTKPWHTIAHIRDTLRFQTKISTFDQIEKAAEFMLSRGYRIVKIDTAKMLEPKEWGWRFAGFDLRAPNGQLIEWYIIFDEMYVAKKKGHLLFEKWRNANEDELKARYDEYRADVLSSRQLYLEAFERGLQKSGYADLEDARADISRLSASLPEMSAKFSARSSALGGANLPLGSQGPSADSRNLSPAGSMTQQRPESRSSSTTGASISDTSSIEADGELDAEGNAANRRENEFALVAAPPADSYALRSLNSITDPVLKGHYEALTRAGTAVDGAVGAIASDRRLDAGERQQLAELYVGEPVEGDPLQAIRDAAAQRGRDARSALLHGFSPEVSPSNLRVRDFDAQMLETALQRLADRLPRQALLVARNVLRLEVGDRVAALEGATLSPDAALSAFGINAGVAKKIIAVSLEYGPDVAMQTFTHEEIHLLRQLGILKGKDWEALAGLAKRRPKKAEATRILDKMLADGKIDQETYDALVSQTGKLTYRQIYQIDERYGDFLNGDEDLLVEETVAHVAADWAQGREMAAPIERALQKIRDFIEAIQNLFVNGIGSRSANDIFESIWAGDLVRRFEEAQERRFEAEERALGMMRREDVLALATNGEAMAAFAGEKAKTADLEALNAAKSFEAEGKSREFIWRETGWFRGVDGRWRFEIDDSQSKLRAFGPDMSMLGIELTHDPMFDAYPELVDVEFNRDGSRAYNGSFQPGGVLPSSITVSKRAPDRRSTTLHEAQHALQDIESFAEGANIRTAKETPEYAAAIADLESSPPDLSWTTTDNRTPSSIANDIYRRFAGEVEARTVQKRMNLTADEREERPPWLDYDVPEDQQIVRMPVEGEQRSMASVDLDMSPEARKARAEAMGFDTSEVLYHGTGNNFLAFDVNRAGTGFGWPGDPKAIWFATSEQFARDVADVFEEQRTVAVYLRGREKVHTASDFPATFTDGDTILWENSEPFNKMLLDARKAGYDRVRFKNVMDVEGETTDQVAVFDPSNIRSIDAAFDPTEDGSPVLMAALRDWMPSRRPTPPQSTPEGESPSLNKIISDLKKTMGMTVSQGLWGFSVQQGNRSARVRPPSNVRGQFDRETGNVSVRQSRDIKTLAHEGGHYLESILGTDLGAIKQAHAEALTGDPAPMPAALSEGFANWFRDYILDPDAAEARAPGMTESFEELLEAERPDMLEGFDTIQQEYQRYITSAPIGEVAAGLSSQYDGTTWRELSKDAALDNVSGKLSTAYQGAIDGLNVAAKGLSYLLKTADANGIRDEDGRPISVKVGDNFYKRLRLFAGSFNRGRVWLDKGVSDLTTGRIIGPSLKAALEKALGGGKFNMQKYKDFNQYLVSIRAIEEYNRLDQKAATVKQYDDTLAKLADARPMLAERLQKDAATLERRQDALTRANAMLADRRRMLGVAETRLENIQERLDGVLADIAEAGEMGALAQDIADPLAENAVSENYGAMVARRRRQVQNLERQQREALRAVERLSEEVSGRDVEAGMLQEEIRQLSDGVSRGRQQIAQLDDMVTRIRKEREAASNRGASRPPTAEPRAVHERVIRELGTPEFQEAAKLVHDFTFSLLEARRQAGFITQEMFDELAKRRDWYVPFWRDMSDIEGAGAMFPGSGVKKWSMFKKFDGSDRSIIMPMEILSEEAYSTAQQIAFNDAVKAMIGLAERVGPGGGKVAERLARAENMEANEETFGRIRQMAIDLGIDPLDAHMITQRMEMNFSDGDIRVIMSPENLGPTAKPQLPMWENGERIMVRLPDPAFGRDLFEAINGLGKEMSDILVKALALPAQALRVGVTSHPDFIFRNIWRDIWTAWKLTGAAPFVTQFRGFQLINERGTIDGMSGEDFRRLYNEAGGIAGGINVNAQIANQRRDVKALLDTNIDAKAIAGGAALGGFTGLAAGSSVGSLLGAVFGGPVGAAVGFKIGATVGGLVGGVGTGYAARHGEVWRFVESFETATRLGVAAHAYKRAKEHNPDLSDMEAITEAAFVSRDIMDWNRRGSKMLAATRLVTFLNAQIQGLDKQFRQMGAYGDRGSALKKHLAIVFKHQSNDILSRDEERDLADAYKSYMRWGAITLMLMGLAALYADDDDYQDIKDETKATHSWFKALGIWFRLPKPFELAVPGNIGEIVWDRVAGRDQRMGERIVDSMYEVLAPPGLPQVMRLTGGILFNRDRQGIFSGRSREIVGENLASRPPHERYHAFTSEFAIDLSRAMYHAGVPQSLIPAPVKTDFVLSAAGAYWGREVQNSYQTAKTMVGMSTRPDRKATDFPILRGFTGEAARMSRGVNDMWTMISREGGEFTMAATEYKQLMDDRGRPVEAEMWLKSLDPEQRVWALTQYYGSRSEKREHPLERASQADRINREIMRDTISDTLAPKVRQGRKTVRDYDEKIELTPAKKTEVIDILARLSQVEARNTMILMKRPGFEGMDIKDPQLLMNELKAASPEVHELLLERRDKKVADWPDVVKTWPKYRDRVLKESVGAF